MSQPVPWAPLLHCSPWQGHWPPSHDPLGCTLSSPGWGRLGSAGPLPWEVSAVSAREVGTRLILKSCPPPHCSHHPVPCTDALQHVLRSHLCISKTAHGCVAWILRLFLNSCNCSHESSNVEGLLLLGAREES